MKPYSKKYLTLALAGLLAASIPATAFAEGTSPNPSAGKTDKEVTQPAPAQPAPEKTPDQIAKEEAERKAKEAEDKAKEEEAKRKEAEKKLKELEEKEKEENRKKYGNITLSNVRYDGKYIKGETSAYAKIYVQDNYYNEFRNRKYIGEADRNGDFSIKYDIKEGKSVTIYAENKDYSSRSVEVKNDNYKDIKGTRIDASELSIFGRVLTGRVKGHAFDFITVYLDGEKLGTVRADKDGKFTLTLNKSIETRELDNLRFYTDAKTVENKKFKVTEALEGQKIVKGTANTDDEITVYDANGKKISNTYVNNAGVFTAFLDRALINGETIKIEARDKDKNITKIEYKVTKMQ